MGHVRFEFDYCLTLMFQRLFSVSLNLFQFVSILFLHLLTFVIYLGDLCILEFLVLYMSRWFWLGCSLKDTFLVFTVDGYSVVTLNFSDSLHAIDYIIFLYSLRLTMCGQFPIHLRNIITIDFIVRYGL